ncbi:MAG: PAS domain-containing protein, partial [Janthinobacterium lividum]
MMLSAPIPMQLFWGPEFVVLYNDALIPIMTGKHPEALGMPAHECWAEAWSIVGPQMQEVFETGRALSFRETIVPINLDGELEEVYWDYSYSPCFGPDGAVEGVIDIAQDVTHSVRSRDRLKASEARARRVLRSIGDAVIVADADARVTIVNPVAEELTGWTESEAQGLDLNEIFPIINEETRLRVENPAEKVRRLGHTVGLANHTILTSRSGRNVHIDDSAAPIRGEDGNLQGIVLVFRDIDERRAAERERDAIAARLNQVLDDTNDSILTINRDWVISYMNPMAKKVAYPLVDVVGKNFWEAYPGASYEGSPFVEHYYRAMDEQVTGSFEAYYPEPINVWVAVAVKPSSEGITIYFTDVTQRKRDA